MYQLFITSKFKRSFKKLDKQVAKIIEQWIDKNLVNCTEPRFKGKALHGKYEGY